MHVRLPLCVCLRLLCVCVTRVSGRRRVRELIFNDLQNIRTYRAHMFKYSNAAILIDINNLAVFPLHFKVSWQLVEGQQGPIKQHFTHEHLTRLHK